MFLLEFSDFFQGAGGLFIQPIEVIQVALHFIDEFGAHFGDVRKIMHVARHGAGMIVLQDHLHVTLAAMQVLLVELRAQLFLLAGQGLVGGQRFRRQFG